MMPRAVLYCIAIMIQPFDIHNIAMATGLHAAGIHIANLIVKLIKSIASMIYSWEYDQATIMAASPP